MNFEPMLFCLILGCLVTLLTLPLLLLSGWKVSILSELQRRNARLTSPESSQPRVSKWGALPLAASFVAVSVLACLAFPDPTSNSHQSWTILATGLAIFTVGLMDDFSPLGPRRRLALQSLVAAVACFQGIQLESINTPLASLGIHLEQWSGLATLGWLVLVIALFQRINSINWLAGSLGLLAMGLLAHHATGNSFAGLCAIGMAGALVGFLVYNLPPTRVRLGSSGAGLLGYLVGILSVSNSHHDHETSVLAVMLIAVLGASFATWRNAIKLLPTYPLRPKPVTRPAISRIASPRSHERR
jgi:UDP-GlcNAc:undecaprenyl-phosphate/decaprenyl-phosphate GlcNAc-1-phosphate transferase